MPSQSMARKFDARNYIEWTREFPALTEERTTLNTPPDTGLGEVERGI